MPPVGGSNGYSPLPGVADAAVGVGSLLPSGVADAAAVGAGVALPETVTEKRTSAAGVTESRIFACGCVMRVKTAAPRSVARVNSDCTKA